MVSLSVGQQQDFGSHKLSFLSLMMEYVPSQVTSLVEQRADTPILLQVDLKVLVQ
jgi:hypothetical protein